MPSIEESDETIRDAKINLEPIEVDLDKFGMMEQEIDLI